jgi:hypothetical protein
VVKHLTAIARAVALRILIVAAAIWKATPSLLEAAGAIGLAVFAAGQLHRGGWLVVGLALVAKAREVEIRRRPPAPTRTHQVVA